MAYRFSPGQPEKGGMQSPSTPTGKDDHSTTAESPSEEGESTMPRKDKVRYWNRKDVSRWLEKRHLVKFVPLFLRNGIVGADLVESKLSFLYDDGVTVADREQLLAEIYMLLHPDSPTLLRRSPPSPALRPIHPKDREKYQAALQVAQSSPTNTSPAPVIVIGPRRSRSPAVTPTSPTNPTSPTGTILTAPTSLTSPTSPTGSNGTTLTVPTSPTSPTGTTLTVPTSAKPRSRSESGVELLEGPEGLSPSSSPSPGRKYLKRKSTPAVHDYLQRGTVQSSSLFDTFRTEGQVSLHCVKVERSEEGSKFGFSYQTLPNSCLLVTNTKPSPSLPLCIGDRIVEVNGVLLPGHKGSPVDTLLKAASLDVVLVRQASDDTQGKEPSTLSAKSYEKLQQELIMGEVRWQSLRQLLTSLQHKSFDPMTLIGTLHTMEDLDDMKKRATLEMEIEELQRNCTELTSKLTTLQTSMKTKDEELLTVRRERDRAVDNLRRSLLRQCIPASKTLAQRHRRRRRGGSDNNDDDGGKDDSINEGDDDDDLPKRTRKVQNSQDLHAVFFDHVELSLAAMERSSSSKEDVIAVLRELSTASRRHAQFVDRLISLVWERAPWMMDELNDLQDASEIPESPQQAAGDNGPPPVTPSLRTSPLASSLKTSSVMSSSLTSPVTSSFSASPVASSLLTPPVASSLLKPPMTSPLTSPLASSLSASSLSTSPVTSLVMTSPVTSSVPSSACDAAEDSDCERVIVV